MSVNIQIGVTYNGRNIRKSFADLNTLRRTGDTASVRIGALGAQMNLLGKSMTSVGRTMTRNISMPLALIGFAAVKSATEFETSFSKIQGLVGVAADQIGELQQAASRLGPQFGKSSNEAAEALFFITSAGFKSAEAIAILESSLKASAIGLGDTATVADLVTSSVNAYGSSVLSASDATDILTNAVRLGKLAPEELAGSIGMVLPLASAMGVEFHEVGAAFAAMSRTGTNAATAGTQLRAILSQLLSVTPEAAAALESVGLNAEDLRKQIREKGLLSVLETLVTAFDGNAAATEAVFGSIRALTGVLDLVGANAEATRMVFDGMANSTGVLNEAFDVTAETAGFKFAQALSELRETLRKMGETLIPFVERLVDTLRGLVDRFNELSPAQQDMIVKFGGIAALAGPILAFFGALVVAIGFVIVKLAAMTVAAALATGGLTLLAGAIAIAVFKNAGQETGDRALALEHEARAARLSAAGYHAIAEAERDRAAALRAGAAQNENEIGRFERQAAALRQSGTEQADAAAAADDLAAALTGLGDSADDATTSVGAAGPRVVQLTSDMRDLFRNLNETNVGAGDAGDSIAQFAREVLAAGNITEDTVRGAERLAQVIRQDIDRALADGNKRLDEAVQKFDAYRDTIARGVTQGNSLSDAVGQQTSALEQLTRAEEDYARAVAGGDAREIGEAGKALKDAKKQQGSFLDFLQVGVTTAEAFTLQIDGLREAGASLEVVQQIAELGAETGGRIASELMAGGAAAVEQANLMVTAVEQASMRAGQAAAQQFFGAGVNAAKAMVRGIEATIPELQSVLDRIAEAIERAMGSRPNVDISGNRSNFISPASGGTGRGGAGPDNSFLSDVRGGAAGAAAIRAADISGLSAQLANLPRMAEGGVVSSATLALIGEAGPEAVIPLDRLGGGGNNIYVTVTSADPQAVVEALRRYTRANGPLRQVVSV